VGAAWSWCIPVESNGQIGKHSGGRGSQECKSGRYEFDRWLVEVDGVIVTRDEC